MFKATSKHLEEWANPRTVILLTALLISALWVVVITSATNARLQSIETTGETLRRTTHAVEMQTHQQLQLVETLLTACVHWLADHPTSDPRFDPGFRRLLGNLTATTHGLVQIRLLTDDGAVFDVLQQRASPTGETARQFLLELGKASELTIGIPLTFQESGLPGLPMVLPVNSGPPHLVGLLAVVDLSALNSLYEKQRLQSYGRILLLTREGNVLLHAPHDNEFSSKRLDIERLLALPMDQSSSGVVLLDQPLIDTEEHAQAGELATYAVLIDHPLIVIVSQPVDEALAPWLRQTFWIVLLAIGITVPLAVVAYRSLRLIHAFTVQHAHLQQLANNDPLTGASNRPYFVDKLAEKIDAIGNGGSALSVLLLDIDFFKRLNDGYGHAIGDQVLIAFVSAAKSCLRDEDLLGRLGAGEFAILLPHTPLKKAVIAAERIRKKTSEVAIESAEGVVSFTTSVGVVQATSDDTTTDGLLRRAGYALQQAKAKGYDRVEVAPAKQQTT